MTPFRARILTSLDRALAASMAGLVGGTVLAFGGASWWAPAWVGGLTAVLVVAWLARAGLSGRWRMLKSPLTGLGLLAVGLAAAQSVPIPDRVAAALSPTARQVHASGTLPHLARSDDPEATAPGPISGRSPLTIDRPATLRWLLAASACLAVFWVASHYVDRLGRLYVVWGSVVGAFLLNAAIALVQVAGQADGLYGFIEPGKGPKWAPTVADALEAPGATRLRPVVDTRPTPHAWALPRPDRPRLVGTMMGGPGALLALGAIGLPLSLALTLQLMAPRGSREGLWTRLAERGQGSLVVLLYGATIAASTLVGMVGGSRMAIPFGVALALVGLPSLVGTGIGWKGFLLTGFCLAGLGGGAALARAWPADPGSIGFLPRVDPSTRRALWSDAVAIARDFPIVGAGLGSFPAAQPYYKGRDASSNTAMSSLLCWVAEAGAVGVALLGMAILWGLVRLPGAIRRVGSADRALAFGMVGALACLGAVSALHWTVELPAVALVAGAFAGTCNRWLAGGTDLFVERG